MKFTSRPRLSATCSDAQYDGANLRGMLPLCALQQLIVYCVEVETGSPSVLPVMSPGDSALRQTQPTTHSRTHYVENSLIPSNIYCKIKTIAHSLLTYNVEA